MKFLVNNLWLLYLLSLVLAGGAYAVIGKPFFDWKYCFITAACAALPNLIAVSGIWFFRKGYMIFAVIAAVLCFAAVLAAGFLICSEFQGFYSPARCAGIAAVLLGILSVILCCAAFSGNTKQIILTACCLCGMLSADYITGYIAAYAAELAGG